MGIAMELLISYCPVLNTTVDPLPYCPFPFYTLFLFLIISTISIPYYSPLTTPYLQHQTHHVVGKNKDKAWSAEAG